MTNNAENTVAGGNKETGLHQAARAGKLELVESLLAQGADPLKVNGDGNTPWECTRLGARALVEQFNDSSMLMDDLEKGLENFNSIARVLKQAAGAAARQQSGPSRPTA